MGLIMKVNIFILSYKKIKIAKLDNCYKYLLCGSSNYQVPNNSCDLIKCDNDGENISKKNEFYSELTGIYWAWKNSSQDIIGFVHYRRFLVNNRIFHRPINQKKIKKILNNFDIILRNNKKIGTTVLENTINSIGEENYNILKQIIFENFSDYYPYFLKVMSEERLAANNIFITSQELFSDYCSFLFSVCMECEKKIDLDKIPQNIRRIFGYIGERLLITWVYKNKLRVYYNTMYNTEWKKFLKLKLLHKTEK